MDGSKIVNFRLRPADTDDALTLFRWRNDPVTVANSISPNTVEWDDHIRWLTGRLRHDPPTLFIFLKNKEPVGTVRVDDDKVSYTVAPEHRGEGIATKMLRAIRETHGCLVAEIYRDNQASIRAAENAGMRVQLLSRKPESPIE